MERAEEILEFWFGGKEGPDAPERNALWFGAAADTDRRIRERFGADLERAARRELDAWAGTPRGRLALIVLLDQFSRNVYRGTPRAFAQDAAALRLCRDGLAGGEDGRLVLVERSFFYLPLEHAEDLAVQEESVRRFTALSSVAPDGFREALDYAVRHRDVIARFGRFPHRNAILARASTAEEEAFLRTHRGFM